MTYILLLLLTILLPKLNFPEEERNLRNNWEESEKYVQRKDVLKSENNCENLREMWAKFEVVMGKFVRKFGRYLTEIGEFRKYKRKKENPYFDENVDA